MVSAASFVMVLCNAFLRSLRVGLRMISTLPMTPDNVIRVSRDSHFFAFLILLCRGCRFFKPKYVAIAEALHSNYEDVEVYAVSCTPHKDICQKYNVQGYPVRSKKKYLRERAHPEFARLTLFSILHSFKTSSVSVCFPRRCNHWNVLAKIGHGWIVFHHCHCRKIESHPV